MAKQIALTYAAAVFDSIRESGKQKEMNEQIGELKKIFKSNPELGNVFTHPNIPKEEKQELTKKVFKGKLIDELYGLIMLLLEKDRVEFLDEILTALVDMYKEDQKIGVVYITTARELKEEQVKAIEKKIIADTGYKSLELNISIDRSLIAGLVIRIGDRRVDSSVATRLENMTRQLKTLQIK